MTPESMAEQIVNRWLLTGRLKKRGRQENIRALKQEIIMTINADRQSTMQMIEAVGTDTAQFRTKPGLRTRIRLFINPLQTVETVVKDTKQYVINLLRAKGWGSHGKSV